MKADRSFIRSQQNAHRDAAERVERLVRDDPLIKTYIETIAERMRGETQESREPQKAKDD